MSPQEGRGAREARAGTRGRKRAARRAVGLSFVAALSALAGMTDAIGFLAAGQFVSFMSGNTTQLAIALAAGDGRVVALLAATLCLYVLGNAFGIVALRLLGGRQPALLTLLALPLATAALLPGPGGAPLAIFCAVLSMGLVNAAVERIDGHAFGITYVTGALSRFGRGLGRRMLGESSRAFVLDLVPFAGMMAGAVAGAAASSARGREALLLPAGLALGLAVASAFIPRGWRRRYVGLPRPRRTKRPPAR
ncbi:DUF1275 family protein [Aurantimonas sp. Leaf443]|uniref:YoaK family protein n=1 Tax=Aurantimonas sp. Leaf443 TaxID=1736378 RepID=UPI000702366A|nr:DUF1275 family protein [Aurantimonas sp. Leaf443]KQT85864.1 hypothetical protein ASG48_04435 [Aurantimonas sp. Leaf443]